MNVRTNAMLISLWFLWPIFFLKEKDTAAWEDVVACLIIINVWLLSVLSQPWLILLPLSRCTLQKDTKHTPLCFKYLLKPGDKTMSLSAGGFERAKRVNDSSEQQFNHGRVRFFPVPWLILRTAVFELFHNNANYIHSANSAALW